MKQKIYTTGLLTTALVFVGGIFKINHWPGAGIMLIAGILLLIFVFLPLALGSNYRAEGNRQNLPLYIVTWLTCLVVFGSMLFKIQHWPGAGKLLMIAIPFPYVVFLPVFLIVTAKNKNFSINNTVFVLLLLAGISVFSVLLSLNVSKDRIHDSLSLSRSYNRIESVLDRLPAYSGQNPVVGQIDELIGIVDDYQARIFAAAGMTEDDWSTDPLRFPRLESQDVVTGALVSGEEDKSRDTRLQSGLQNLIQMLGSTPGYEDLSATAPVIFEFAGLPGAPDEWTRQMFMTNTRAWSLIYLDGLETNLKLLRSNMN